MIKEKVLDIVNKINNGEIDEIEDLFGGMSTVFNIINKFDMLHLIDPFSINDMSDRNSIIHQLIQNDKTSDKIVKQLIERLADIEEKNGEYYLDLNDLTDLTDLFESYRSDVSPKDVAKSVLSEDYWEPFWDTTDNVYRDVIYELNPENKKYFRNKVLKLLENQDIELDGRSSDLMDELASEQNSETSFKVNEKNIDRIINDEDTMLWLLKNNLDDLRGDLYSVHNNAYNSAYTSEIYRQVWDGLGEYIDTSSSPEWYKFGKGSRVNIKVTYNQLKSLISDFFKEYQKYGDDFDYYGSYLGNIEKLMSEGPYDRINFRISDYPDFREVDKQINQYFGDYI